MACVAFEVEGSDKGIEAVSMEAENTRERANKFSDALTNLSAEFDDFGEEVLMGIEVTWGQHNRFQRFLVDLMATVEIDGEFVFEWSIRDLPCAVWQISLRAGRCTEGMEFKIAVGNMKLIAGNLVRNEAPIVYANFV